MAAGILTLNRTLVGVFYDDGLYAGLATALSSGHGYVHPNLPGMPGAVHYPPLYPVILAPLFGLFSVSGAALGAKLLNAFLAACGAAVDCGCIDSSFCPSSGCVNARGRSVLCANA